jgi:adenine-specific DNA-methyltransferase
VAKKVARARQTKAPRKPRSKAPAEGKTPKIYEHTEEKLLLRPDVGLQPQFKPKKAPKAYRYDPSLDPSLSWDVNADRERGEALIAEIENAKDLNQARAKAAELRRMSRPFLNWAGKAERRELTVPTLPLFVHERLSTQAILQSVKSHKRDRQQTLALFADEELDVTDRLLKAYEHPTPWVNRIILGDSLVVMNSLLQYEGMGGQVQMIYMDPPYGVRFGSNFQPFIRKRDVKHGDDADLTREPEMVQAYRDTWELGLHSYLTYSRDRLRLCHDLLSPTGVMFLQIGDENVHHVREVLDEVFGSENFISQITFLKTSGSTGDYLSSTADFLLVYARDRERVAFRDVFLSKSLDELGDAYQWIELKDGTRRRMTLEERGERQLVPQGARIFRLDNLQSQSLGRQKGEGAASWFPVEFEGQEWRPSLKARWKTNEEGMRRLLESRRLYATSGGLYYVRYADDFRAQPITNTWTDTVIAGFASNKLYVVETSSKVVQRCMLMATGPGDLVLDPTCGSGTTAHAAEHWGRRWIAIDASRVPLVLARQRLLTATYPYFELRNSSRGPVGGFVYSRRRNQRGEEIGGIIPHTMLETIAKGQAPRDEVLVDRPDVGSGVIRVSGPFVVEATIPTAVEIEAATTARERERDYTGDLISRMTDTLRSVGVLRMSGGQTISLKNVRRPAKALSLHAEGEAGEKGNLVAFCFGPEHGPVTEQMVFAAAKEASLKNYGHLYVIGFAIQPGASRLIQNCEVMAGVPATYVQATMDLLMGDLLKTTRASQIFAVTGAPDVRLVKLKRKNGNGPLYHVELRGLDVFDPVTMQNDHRKGDDVPAWFVDVDYDDLVFRVRQAFFPRTSAWDGLKRALKATYDDSVWEHLAGTVSEPFAAGDQEKVAVKVIDDRGNELMVVRPLTEAEAER